MISTINIINNDYLQNLFNNSRISVYNRSIYIKPNFDISYDKALLNELEAIVNIGLNLFDKDMEANIRFPKDSIIIRFYHNKEVGLKEVENILLNMIDDLKKLQIDYTEYSITFPKNFIKLYSNTPEYIREKNIIGILE